MPNQNQKQNNSNLEPKSKQAGETSQRTKPKCPIKIETLMEYWDLMKQHYSRDPEENENA